MAVERSSIIITVFSTAPGVGKTLVATNFAAGLAKEGYNTCLIDLDLQFGDVENYLGFRGEYTLADARQALLEADARGIPRSQVDMTSFLTEWRKGNVGFAVLPAPHSITETYGLESRDVMDIVEGLRSFEYIVIDTTAVFSDLNMDMLDISTSIIFLGIMDFIPAIKNLKSGYDVLLRFDYEANKIRLVQNRSDSQKLVSQREVEKLFGREFYYNLPNDFPTARSSINFGVPAVLGTTHTKLGDSLWDLVGMFTNRPEAPKETTKPTGFFAKLSGLFR
ncbi:MAG: P-loop NTPase [Selenomonadaceae bacterium]|nr:P-loop NTPase [Selenomonadaceae bacterium]